MGVSKRKAAEKASGEFNVNISPSTALRAAERPGQEPIKRGRELILGAGMEARLEMFRLVLREMRIPILRYMIMNYANTMICGTKTEAQFKYKEVRRHWDYHWLGRCIHLKTGNIRPLDITRAEWATAKNALAHYTTCSPT